MHTKDAVIIRAIPNSERYEKQEFRVCGFPSIAPSHRESILMKEALHLSWIPFRSMILGKRVKLQHRDDDLFS